MQYVCVRPGWLSPISTRIVPAWQPGHEWEGWHDLPRAGLTDGVAVMANQRVDRGPPSPG